MPYVFDGAVTGDSFLTMLSDWLLSQLQQIIGFNDQLLFFNRTVYRSISHVPCVSGWTRIALAGSLDLARRTDQLAGSLMRFCGFDDTGFLAVG